MRKLTSVHDALFSLIFVLVPLHLTFTSTFCSKTILAERKSHLFLLISQNMSSSDERWLYMSSQLDLVAINTRFKQLIIQISEFYRTGKQTVACYSRKENPSSPKLFIRSSPLATSRPPPFPSGPGPPSGPDRALLLSTLLSWFLFLLSWTAPFAARREHCTKST